MEFAVSYEIAGQSSNKSFENEDLANKFCEENKSKWSSASLFSFEREWSGIHPMTFVRQVVERKR